MRSLAPPARAHHPTGVPCVEVVDVGKAAVYYQRFFGFVIGDLDDDEAWLVGHGVAIRLRHSGPAAATVAQSATVLFVDQPAVLRRRLDDLGAHFVDDDVTSRWPEAFGVRDCYGNVIAFCPTGGLGALRGSLGDRADRIVRALCRQRADRRQSYEVERLRDFVAARGNGPGTFYVHVHGGLLHWLAATVSRLPSTLDVVVVGSDLSAAEQKWIRTELRRPLHHVPGRLDDAGAIELLSASVSADFGWIEVGCLVLDATVLSSLADAPAGTALSCAWAYDSGMGFPIAAPYLLYFDAAALRTVLAMDPSATAGVHGWTRFNRQVEGRRCYSRIPSARARRLLGKVVPLEPDGRPRIPGGLPFFETTVLYQLLARAAGLGIHCARNLSALGNARGEAVQDEYSDELVYIGALSYADPLEEFSGYFHDDSVRQLYLLAERVVLTPVVRSLPSWYRHRATMIDDALGTLGLDPEEAARAVSDYLVTVRGLSAAAAGNVADARSPSSPTAPRDGQEKTD